MSDLSVTKSKSDAFKKEMYRMIKVTACSWTPGNFSGRLVNGWVQMDFFFMLKRNDEVIAVAASPEILNLVEPIEIDTTHPFYSTEQFNARMLWIGTSTSYKNVFRLRPNHLINLGTGQIERFYPCKKLRKLSLDEAAKIVAALLPNLLKAVFNRQEKIMIGLTGYKRQGYFFY